MTAQQPDTITIPLTNGYSTVIDVIDCDLAMVHWRAFRNPCYTAGKMVVQRSQRISGRQTSIYLHRVILGRVLNRALVSAEIVDHIDRNPLNNQRANLRLATPSQNRQNSSIRSDNTTGVVGVGWFKPLQKWRARIQVNGKSINLGCFSDFDDAVAARHEAELRDFGEFSPLLSRQETA